MNTEKQQEENLNFDLYVDDPTTGLRLIKKNISIEEYMESYILDFCKEEHVARKPDIQNGGFIYYSLLSLPPLERTSKGCLSLVNNKSKGRSSIGEVLNKHYPLDSRSNYNGVKRKGIPDTFFTSRRGDSFNLEPFKSLFYGLYYTEVYNSSSDIIEGCKVGYGYSNSGKIGAWGSLRILDISKNSGLKYVYFSITVSNCKRSPIIQFEPHFLETTLSELRSYLKY